jgi:hypothetical protein
MHVHWLGVIVLFIGTFIANHYFILDDESKVRKYFFYSLLFLMFAGSGSYLWRFILKLPDWRILELLGFITSGTIFFTACWIYKHWWQSRGRK